MSPLPAGLFGQLCLRCRLLSGQHPLIFPLLSLYLLSMLISSFVLVGWLSYQVEQDGQRGLARLDDFITQINHTLAQVTQTEARCGPQTVTSLRSQVFATERVKEIGLFDRDFTIYCVSNEGPVSFRLYSQTRDRLQSSDSHGTLSLSKAKLNKSQSLFIYYRNEAGMGADALLRPQTFLDLVNQQLSFRELPMDVQVIERSLNPTKRDESVKVFHSFLFELPGYPLTLRLCVTNDFLFWYLIKHSWLGLLLGSVLGLVYFAARLRRLSRNSLPNALQRAIEKRELEVHYQPIVNQISGEIIGMEALLRWHHPQEGYISPGIFIPLAEKLNLIVPLTDFVLDDISHWLSRRPELFGRRYISINISRLHLLQQDLAGQIKQRCEQNTRLASHLLLEITEDNVFSEQEMKQVLHQFTALRALGIRLAVDDFGTGYSGLDFIRRYPFDILKIDQVFIKSLGGESAAKPLLEAIIKLAQELNMQVIAEGVEYSFQARSLQVLGVDLLQGFLYARPMPKQDITLLLQKEAPFATEAQPRNLDLLSIDSEA